MALLVVINIAELSSELGIECCTFALRNFAVLLSLLSFKGLQTKYRQLVLSEHAPVGNVYIRSRCLLIVMTQSFITCSWTLASWSLVC